MTNPIMECDDLKNLMENREGRVAVCVILKGRGSNSQTQLVTYGETAEDKVESHDLKEFIKDAMFAGYVPAVTVHESFILDAAKVKQQRDEALQCLHEITAMRGAIAIGGSLPMPYECFDDWAADKAESMVDRLHAEQPNT